MGDLIKFINTSRNSKLISTSLREKVNIDREFIYGVRSLYFSEMKFISANKSSSIPFSVFKHFLLFRV